MIRDTLLALGALAVLLASAGAATAAWDQFRHDDAHTGQADQPGVIQDPYEPWTFSADGPVVSSPAVTDVDGERTVVLGSYPGQGQAGTLYAVGPDGSETWSSRPLDVAGGYISSPTVEDVDGDDGKEVAVATLDDSTLRLFDAADGSQEWSDQIGATGEDLIASSPVVADVTDDDDGDEIVLGGSTDDQNGSALVYDTDGTQLQALELDGPAWSTPLVTDLDDDGEDEVALTTGVPDQLRQLFPNAKTGGKSLYAFETGPDGLSIKWSVTLDGPTIASPVAEDVDDDGETEVVVGDREGKLWAVDGATGSVEAGSENADDVVGPLAALSSPVAADVDDDGGTEVVLGSHRGVRSFHLTAPDGSGQSWVLEGEMTIPKAGPNDDQDPWVGASLARQDVDGDGTPDLVGMTVPINVTDEILDSDALPGRVFSVDGPSLDAGGDTVPFSEVGEWSVTLPDDGGLGGPTLADLDGDGDSEVLAGEGVPLIGNASTLHSIDAANPAIDGVDADPPNPTDLESVDFSATVRDEDTDETDLSYRWDFDDGGTATGPTPSHQFPDDGAYDVTLTVEDPDGHDDTAVLPVDVRNVPPSVAPGASTTPDDLNVTLRAGASDADGTVERVEWDLGDGANATGANVTHEYPTGGTYAATATATDDDGDATSANVTFSVNRFPTLDGPDAADVDEGETLTLDLDYDDPDGDPVADLAVGNASGAEASADGSNVTVTWTVPYDVATRDDSPALVPVETTAQDDGSPQREDSHTVDVTVTHVNRAPEAADDPTTTLEDEAVTVDVLANDSDPDGHPLTVADVTAPDHGTATANGDGTVTYTPDANDNGPDAFTYSATDGNATDTAAVNLTVEPVNDPPEASDDAATTLEDQAVTVDVLANDSDPDGHPLTVADVTAPDHGTATANGDGTVTYTPDANDNGPDAFTYTAADGNATDTATVNLTVEPVEDAPEAGDDAATTPLETPVAVDVLADDGDPDGDEVAIVDVGSAGNGTVADEGDGTLSYTPDDGFVGEDAFDYTISDGNLTDEATMTVTVTDVNDPPTIEPPTETTFWARIPTTLAGSVDDPNGDDLSVSGDGLPPNASLAIEDGSWVLDFRAVVASETTYEVAVTVTDGRATATTDFDVTVRPNDPPEPAPGVPTSVVEPDTTWSPSPVELDGSGSSDPDGHDLVGFTWSAAGETLEGENATTAFPDRGTYDVSLAVEDETGLTSTAATQVVVDDALTGALSRREVPTLDGADQVVILHVVRDDGTVLEDHPVNVTLSHEDIPGVATTKTATTDEDGTTVVRFRGDAGSSVFLPGKHRLEASTSAPSAAGAPVDDTETLRMVETFTAPGPGGS